MSAIVLPTFRRYSSGRPAWRDWVHTAAHRLHQTCCAIRGHRFLIHRERRRLSLECTDCGYQTRGWVLAPTAAGTARNGTRTSRTAGGTAMTVIPDGRRGGDANAPPRTAPKDNFAG